MTNTSFCYAREDSRILKLQRDYKAGLILEDDISAVDKERLIELYKKQNLELKQQIEVKRQSLKKRLEKLSK